MPWPLLADTVVESFSWTGVVTAATNIGFASVVAWYLLTRALPNAQKVFTGELGQVRKTFVEEIRTVRDRHDEREAAVRSDHKDALNAVIAHWERESQHHRELIKVELSLVSKALNDQREVLEDLRNCLLQHQEVGK
jgi:hypothetical protein